MKVCENIGSIVMTFMCGYIREKTKSYFAVCAMMSLVSLIATIISYYYSVQVEKQQENHRQKFSKEEGKDIEDTDKTIDGLNYDTDINDVEGNGGGQDKDCSQDDLDKN